MEYEIVIGLEVHVQLNTKTKAFCACSTEFGSPPNTQVCPVCLGFPGSLPVLNQEALVSAIKVGLAFSCSIQEYTKFDRKNYFYPDLPKNYQISQYDLPLSRDGFLDITTQNIHKRIRIRRVHLEEDAGKLIHKENVSLVDFNRTGITLLEIVSEPDISTPDQAYEYLVDLKSVIEYLDVSDCDMEKGILRCDANISLREKGKSELGVKTELKNLNSFKAVRDALYYEAKRQEESLNQGEKIIQETRLWDAKESRTVSMRTKEEAHDYRYFPEPDLPPFIIDKKMIEEIRRTIPELPQQKKMRFMRDYGIGEYDAGILVLSKKDAQYAESCLNAYSSSNKKPVVNFIIGPLLFEANAKNSSISDLGLLPQHLVELVAFTDKDLISNLSAKAVLTEMIETKKPASEIVQKNNLMQISDTSALDAHADEVIKANPKSVADFKAGKNNAVMFLVGQVMKKTSGKANPKVVQELLREKLSR